MHALENPQKWLYLSSSSPEYVVYVQLDSVDIAAKTQDRKPEIKQTPKDKPKSSVYNKIVSQQGPPRGPSSVPQLPQPWKPQTLNPNS